MSAAAIVAGLTQVVSLPDIFIRLDTAIADPCATFTRIADIIRDDTGLSARLLRIVNSPFYGFPAKIDSISHAMTIVGTSQLRDLALATCVMAAFRQIDTALASVEAFWRHSIAVGIAAKLIGDIRRCGDQERLFLLGVLHDIGRLVLLAERPKEMGEAIHLSLAKKELLYLSERTVFGFDHAQVGQTLLKAWRLPSIQQYAAGYHHAPTRAPGYPTEVGTIHCADFIVNALALGSSGERLVPPLTASVWTDLGLDANELPEVMDRTVTEYQAITDLFLQE